mgnify:CR=1 FL=1
MAEPAIAASTCSQIVVPCSTSATAFTGSIAVVVVGGRYLLRQLFRIAARIGVPEMLTASALLTVLGAGLLVGGCLLLGLGAPGPHWGPVPWLTLGLAAAGAGAFALALRR